MVTCSTCGELFQYDKTRQMKMDWNDITIPHVCTPALKQQEKNEARNYYEEKDKKIEALALAKIAALNHIADTKELVAALDGIASAIRELATAFRETK